eukprot:Platyproteum_vivax@DN4658_c0_g1_i2.p1
MTLRFDERVVVITGSGGGLGRMYALEYAKRGAKVVVNDLGAGLKGETGGTGVRPADRVVAEVQALGGTAVASYDSVEHGDKIIQTAIDSFGRVDVLVNNAGILRDMSIAKMTDKDWDLVMLVHLQGAYKCLKAAWPYFQKQRYGRVVNTSSPAGANLCIYGNFGQLNYAAAKSALIGFSKTAAVEGQKKNIHCNCIAPLAGTRMTETIMSKEMVAALKPEFIAPFVLWLTHESCQQNGQLYEVAAGSIAKVRVERSKGHIFDGPFTPEDVEREHHAIENFSNTWHPARFGDSIAFVENLVQLRSSI